MLESWGLVDRVYGRGYGEFALPSLQGVNNDLMRSMSAINRFLTLSHQ